MKLSKTILPLLLSSALWIPMAYAADTTSAAPNPQPQSTTGTPNDPGAVQPQPVVPPADTSATTDNAAATTNASTTASANVDTSGWAGKTVKGSDGKKLGTVSAAAGDKVTVDSRWGSVEFASNLVAADEAGDLKASTTSTKDVQAMAKSQQGDMKGAQVASKRHFAKKEPKAKVQPASMTTGTETTPTESAPAGEAPAATPDQAPAGQVNPTPPATQQPTTPQSPQH